MADEEVKSCSYLSFADRYQADLELIYQKYECLEDGTFESQEILLSTLGFEENDDAAWLEDFIDENVDLEEERTAADDDDSDVSSDDDGWESDSSGHTTTRELSSLDEASHPNSANETLKELDEQNCEIIEKSKLKQFNHPLSSTLAIESSTTPEIEMDPKLSSEELQESNFFKDPKRLENMQRKVPNHTLGQATSNSFMPGILDENILTSTKLESSPDRSTPKQNPPPLPKDALWLQPITNKIDKRTVTDQIEKTSSAQGISSFAQAVLNTRNRIANVLFKAVMDVQKGNLSKDSGYNSLSTDTSSSLTTVESTFKGSLFLPDKLLKEFNNRLTAEIMGNGNNARRLAEPNHSFSNISLTPSLTKESQSLKKKSRFVIGPRVISNNKDKTVTGKKTMKFNPSLPEFKKGKGLSSLLNDRKSVYIPLSVNTKTVDKQGHLSRAVSTKAVLKISPVQGSLPAPLVPKNVMSIKTAPCERTSYGNSLLPKFQEPVSLNQLREEKQVESSSRIRLVGKTSKPVVKLQSRSRPCVSKPHRRSVPITNCLPVTDSEILRHSTNLSDFQKLMQNHVKIPGRAREGFPGYFPGNPKDSLSGHDRLQTPGLGHGRQAEGKNLPGRDGTEVSGNRPPGQYRNGHSGENYSAGSSRKRSFDSALFCTSEKTSPKRTCLRLNKNENKSLLKLGFGRENFVGANTNDKQQQILMNVKRNTLESFSNKDVPKDNWHGISKKQESRTCSFEDEVVECREGRRSHKLFMDGKRCSYVLDEITPCDRVKILWKTSDNVNTRSGYENGYGNIAAEGRHQESHRNMVQVGKERRIAVSPVQGNHLSKELVGQEEQKQPEKNPVNGRNEDKCPLVNTTWKSSCTITSQEESSGYKMMSHNNETPYECAADERYSERLSKSSRKSFPGVRTSRRNSRPISELDDQTSRSSTRTKYSNHREENNAMSLNSHEKLTSKRNLAPTTAQVSLSRRKRERESKDEDMAQERFNNGVCLNKTFKIDRKAVSDRSDSSACQSNTCMKLLCLKCGNFPSRIQDSCVSSDSSFKGK